MMPSHHAVLPIVLSLVLVQGVARADEKAQCAGAYSSAQDLRAGGRLRAARDQLKACSNAACPAFMVHDCTSWLAEVEESIPTVVFAAKDAAGNDLLAVRVLVDGQPFLDKLDGSAAALDPGPHTVRFETEGALAIEKQIVARVADKNRAVEIVFEPTNKPAPPMVTPTPHEDIAPVPPITEAKPTEQKPSGGSGMRVAGVVIGVTGLLALGAGVLFWDLAANNWSDFQKSPAQSRYSQAASDADFSTAFFIGGAAGVVLGTILYIAAPHSKKTSSALHLAPTLTRTGAGISFGGSF
jgi:hypothetical protein